ncbi:zinc finger protein 124 [Microcaecilia unicolor]|uniref:Zinc finger protein 124-like n=1 Tax=Microcaecilia unicolor TaxID=1415580 RepID=A0A6P7YHT3_9AMPH|nr:zinc finger protein 124-like [Microcaecilia unicolor]XP_030064506.1 zinc finger protein 124-like [Microcaecilia unicolor]XP_030064514.1 zinc finger protein 124-like [Microcaecilia unicolor]XP_030064523.1 zinc finger protein 124-like [Microcaecilia unicolor]
MNGFKYRYQYIPPVTLHLGDEIMTSRLYTSVNEGFEVQIANLVDMFLVEVYRCKLCQFASSIKTKIELHISNVHQLDRIHHGAQNPEICSDHEENDSYSLGDEIGQGAKENEESLEKMPFLLPMYRILNNMTPESCDMNLGDHSDGAHVAHTCEVNTLFDEESSPFQLDEPTAEVSNHIPCSSRSPESKSSRDDVEAQSEHLMFLGLCRISNMKSQPAGTESRPATAEEVPEGSKHERTPTVDNKGLIQPLKNSHSSEMITEGQRHFCNICNQELKTKGMHRIHLKCHTSEQGFKCIYCSCCMSEWKSMEKHIETHKPVKETYPCLVCKRVFMRQSAWKMHKKRHQEKVDRFYCTKCPSFYGTERVKDLHVACHYEDLFKCLHCGLMDKEWSKVYKHLGTHDINLKWRPCSQCGQKFFRIADLKGHMAKHKNTVACICSLCGKTLKCRREMNKHHRLVHSNQKARERWGKKKEIKHGHPDMEETGHKRKHSKEFFCHVCHRKCSSKMTLQRTHGSAC